MSSFTQKLKEKLFDSNEHPYRYLKKEIETYLKPNHILLDAGCGRYADFLMKFKDKARTLIGVDLVDFEPDIFLDNINLLNCDLKNINLESESVDIITSRSVLEHLDEPLFVYREIHRVLRHGGYFIFLTPNLGHYSTLFSKVIPNKFHPWIIRRTEGREEKDVFPTYYRSNSSNAIKKLAKESNFNLLDIKFLGQYPCYFMFNPILFLFASSYEKAVNRYNIFGPLRGWILVVLQKSPSRDKSSSQRYKADCDNLKVTHFRGL